MYKIIDKKYKQRIVDFGNAELIFRDYQANATPQIAYRLSRTIPEEFIIENVEERVPFDINSWSKEKRLIWTGNFSTANGFGMVAENTVRYLIESGVLVQTPGAISGNLISGGEYVDDKVKTAFSNTIFPNCLEIQHCQPPSLRPGIVDRMWIYTMFETTHTPKRWINLMNTLDHVLVPTHWLVDSWKEQGLKVPIDVYGHGLNPDFLHYIERPIREPYTFLHYCQLSGRKGTDLVVRAFQEEFRGDNGAKLIVKNTYPFFPFPLGIKNIEYITATYSKAELNKLLARSDCFVFPTRGEGFGLTPFEAMATGLPTIVTGWSGPTDYINKEDTLILDYTMRRAVEFDHIYRSNLEPGETTGEWAEPNFQQLKHYMRWCYDNREKAKDMGKKAAERLAIEWTWKKKVEDLVSIIDHSILGTPKKTEKVKEKLFYPGVIDNNLVVEEI